MGKVVGVRFHPGAKIYDFDSGHYVLAVGDKVVVETELGLVLGEVARGPRVWPEQMQSADHPPLKKVHRLANEEDLAQLEQNRALEKEGMAFCRERISSQKLAMNLCKVECLFDRSKIIFYFTAETRQDFRELVRELVAKFRTRVEMRQIGVRHEAKLLGGLGGCGRELCCATFLGEFEPVSVKMAKEQNLSLNPTKISGLCGRLMCCLTYEYETYRYLRKGMPKLGKKIILADGREAKVVRQSVLERKLTVLTADGDEITMSPEELAGQLAKAQESIDGGDAPADQIPPDEHDEHNEHDEHDEHDAPEDEPEPEVLADEAPADDVPRGEAEDGAPARTDGQNRQRRQRPRRRGDGRANGKAPQRPTANGEPNAQQPNGEGAAKRPPRPRRRRKPAKPDDQG